MNKMKKAIAMLSMVTVIISLLATVGCKKSDDSSSTPAARQSTYTLKVKDVLGVSGTVTFIETSSTTTTVVVTLTGAPSGTHPAQICMNSAIEGGNVVADLNPVDATGKSTTAITVLTYTQLIAYDGFVRVQKSTTEPNVILAMGDIGGNVITTTNKTYNLDTVGSYGVSGTALFEKRVNGNTLITITLTGTLAGQSYPATINIGSVSTVGGGPVAKTLNNVDGTTGKSYTNVKKLDNNTAITYDNWMVYDGYLNVYQNSVSLANVICHGNIGSN